MNKILVSVIVPTFNEAQTVEELIDRTSNSLRDYEHEIIVVDDTSTDGTADIVQGLSSKRKNIILIERKERGKSGAILKGFGVSKGKYIVTIDADLQYMPEDIPKLLIYAKNNRDIVVGKRIANDTGLRRLLSLGFSTIFGRIILGLPVSDVQSGLKVIRREVLEDIKITADKWDFDVELLYKAKKKWKIDEVAIPFDPRKSGKTKVSVFPTMMNLGFAALRLLISRD